MLNDEKTKGNLKRRSQQAILHVTFTELRITQLEEQLRKLEAELHDKPDHFKLSVTRRQCPVYKSLLKLSAYGEFRQTNNLPTHERPSLEVLVTEHGTSYGPEHGTANESTSIWQREHQRTPERLRIRYTPLINTLEQVCKERLSSYQSWDAETKDGGGAPTVILRPWKLFIAYENEIRNSMHDLESLVESAQQDTANGGAVRKRISESCK